MESANYLFCHKDEFEQNSSVRYDDIEILRSNPMKTMIEMMRHRQENANANHVVFVAFDSPPHLFVDKNNTHFRIWGPLFTVLVEAVKYLNFSLAGIIPDAEKIVPAIANVKPDLILTPFWPQLKSFRALVMSTYLHVLKN